MNDPNIIDVDFEVEVIESQHASGLGSAPVSCPPGQMAVEGGGCQPLAASQPLCPEDEDERADGCVSPDGQKIWSRQAKIYRDPRCPQGMAAGPDGDCYPAKADTGFFTRDRLAFWIVGVGMGIGIVLALQDAKKRKFF